MTEHAPSKATAHAARRRPALYRTVLSLGIAAIVAAWLPFSVFYINALSQRVAAVSAISTLHATGATASPSSATTLTPIKTRAS